MRYDLYDKAYEQMIRIAEAGHFNVQYEESEEDEEGEEVSHLAYSLLAAEPIRLLKAAATENKRKGLTEHHLRQAAHDLGLTILSGSNALCPDDVVAIWSTAGGMHYGLRRWTERNDPNLASMCVAIEYRSHIRPDSRPLHSAMHGFVADKNDPIWNIILPPCGVGCLCDAHNLSQSKVAQRGLTDSEGNLKQPRFYANPFQEEIVAAAEANLSVMVDGQEVRFPDMGFAGWHLAAMGNV